MSASPSPSSTLESTAGQLRTLAQRLSAYIPFTLTRKILQNDPLAPGQSELIKAATMFADLSGFTPMAEGLAVNGARGTEALSRALLMTFTSLINAIHDAGGAVSHFHGDAMMIYFPDTDGQAASRALASAQFMQRLMQTNFAEVKMMDAKAEAGYKLSIKIGVGYGDCLELLVGDTENMEFVLVGTAVDEAVAAQMQAAAGQVVASMAVLKAASLPAGEPFRLVEELPPVPNAQERFFWEAYEQPALIRLITAVPAFIPPSLFERLQDRSSQSISEHRSVTSMFVQFDGIDFADPAAGKQLQSYYQWAWQMVQRYGGPNSRVNRVLMGDKGNQLHILFGAPVAPDAPEQALRCALAMQQKRPNFIRCQRIGLTAGRVFAGAVGSLNRREYTVVGRMVNLSARLTQICPPDGILIDAETAVRVQPHIVSKPLPAMALKGHREPVQIYQVVAEQTAVTQAQTRFQQWQQPPAGRSEELALLFERLTAALAGDGGLVAIHGSYGSGQMPFLAAGVRHWLAAGGRALVGVCQQHTSDVPYAPWVSVWRDFFEVSPDMQPADQLAQINERIAQLTPDVANGLTFWRELLGPPLRSTALLVNLPAVVRQMRLFKLVQRSLAAAVAERPYLIVLEDIHLADPASLDLLDALAQFGRDLPLLLLVTYRSGGDFHLSSLIRGINCQIALNDFTPQQARQLILERLGTDELPLVVEQRLGLRDRQGRESAVNPLFLEETLQLMLASDVMAAGSNKVGNGRLHFDEARLAQMHVPDTINTLLLARLDQLPAAERGLLQFASVIGREFDLATLVAISPGLNRESALELLDALVQTDLVQQLSAGLVPTYLFQHNLVHQVVYQSLTYARRQALHASIAEIIIRESGESLPTQYPILAYHFSQTDRHRDGLKYALLAAQDAEAAYHYRGAADFYKQAAHHLAALDDQETWETAVSIAVARSKILVIMGQLTQAWELADEALQLCLAQEGLPQTLPLHNLMAEILLRQARYAEVPTLAAKVVNSLPPDTPAVVRGQASLLWGQALAEMGELPAAVDRLRQAESIFREAQEPRLLAQALLRLAEGLSQRQTGTPSLTLVQEAEKYIKANSDPALSGQKAVTLSRIQLRLGRTKLALAAAETAVSSMRSAGPGNLARTLLHRARVHIYAGQLAAALADLQRATDLLDAMDDVSAEIEMLLLWVDFAAASGDWQQVEERLVAVRQLLADQFGNIDRVLEPEIRYKLGLAWASLHSGRWSEAARLFQQLQTAVAKQYLVWWQPAVHYGWGMLLLARAAEDERGKAVAQAHQSFRAGLQAVEQGGCPDELPLILLQLGQTAREMGDDRCWHYLKTAVQSAQQRARHADRVFVLQEAGKSLLIAPDTHLHQLGQKVLQQSS